MLLVISITHTHLSASLDQVAVGDLSCITRTHLSAPHGQVAAGDWHTVLLVKPSLPMGPSESLPVQPSAGVSESSAAGSMSVPLSEPLPVQPLFEGPMEPSEPLPVPRWSPAADSAAAAEGSAEPFILGIGHPVYAGLTLGMSPIVRSPGPSRICSQTQPPAPVRV